MNVRYLMATMLLFFSISLFGANIKVITKYGKTGGIKGALNTITDKINGVDICQNNPTAGCDFSNASGWSDNNTPNDGSDDTHNGDLLVRTNDIFEVISAWSWNGAVGVDEDTITLKSTLPSSYEWEDLPGSCDNILSSISADKKSIVCVRKDFDKNSVGTVSEDLTFGVKVLGSTANGTQPGDISFEVTAQNATASIDSAGISLTVTAAPRWNLQKALHTTSAGYIHNGVEGFRLYYKYYIEVDEVSGEIDNSPGFLGVESMGADASFSFTDELNEVSPNAALIECKADTWSSSGDPYPYFNVNYPERSVATLQGAQAINCTQSGSSISVTLDHVDARLDHIPTKSRTGLNLPVNRAIAAIGVIQVFIPLQDVKNGVDGIAGNTDDGSLPTINKLTSFDPTAPSGNSNFGANFESENDNKHALTLYASKGNFQKGYTVKHGLHVYTEGGSANWRSGDGLLTANAEFASRLSYSNAGGTDLTNVQMCDVIDANRMEIVDVTQANRNGTTISGPFEYYTNKIDVADVEFEYASSYVDNSWLASNGGDLNVNHGQKIADECSALGVWHDTPAAAKASGLGVITKVRVKVKSGVAFKPGAYIYAWIKHKVRAAKLDGTPLENGDEIVNYGSVVDQEYRNGSWYKPTYKPNAYPNPPTAWGGDRVTFSGGKVRIIKTVDRSSVEPGNIVNFTLDSSYTNDTGTAETTLVTIKDILPKGLSYISLSTQNASEPAIGTCADVVDLGEPCTADNQVLIWNLGTKTANVEIDNLIYQAQIKITAAQGTVTNYAMIEAPSDYSIVTQRKSDVNLNITIPATINLSKNVVDTSPQETNGAPIDYEINARNGSPITVTKLDIIDILPFNGDGLAGAIKFRDLNLQRTPPTSYHGSRKFESMELIAHPESPGTCDLSPGVSYYYTQEISTNINLSPKEVVNHNPGVGNSIWCEGDVNGPNAGCGFTKEQVTAVRVSGPSMGVDGICQMKLKMSVSENLPDDFYNNQAGANAIGVTLPVLSNSASTVIVKSSLGNFVWYDTNANGIQESGEVGINDINVSLYKANGTLVETITTANDNNGNAGYYEFSQLHSGDYYISIASLADYSISPKDIGSDDKDSDIDQTTRKTANITLAPDTQDLTYDIGIYKKSSIGDTIWYDSDKDGIQDVGENCSNINIIVKLLDASNTEVSSQTTNNCKYLFADLDQGTYKVKFELPNGYKAAQKNVGGDRAIDSDIDLTSLLSDDIVLANGDNVTDIDFGFFALTSIGNLVWLDSNANGIQDNGEIGLDGVNVELLDGNGVALNLSTTTTNGGNYIFENLTAGMYKVKFTLPQGYKLSPQNQGQDDEKDSDAPASLITDTITLTNGQEDRSWDIGLYQEATLGDLIWIDDNNDGIQNNGENCKGLNVEVKLLDINNQEVATQTTNNCSYEFTNLKPNSYKVKFLPPNGYTPAIQNVGAQELDSDINLESVTSEIILSSGENIEWVDAGFVQNSSLGNFVWLDENTNGIQDNEEVGLKDIDITLLHANGTSTGMTTKTDENGFYNFSDLSPADYRVKFTVPEGYLLSPKDVGGDDSKDSDVDNTLTTDITTLDSGENDHTWDLGLYALADLGDKVWLDIDANGIQDAGEIGIQDIDVTLLNADGTPTGRVEKTDENGNYLFAGIAPNEYRVKFSVPPGYQISPQNSANDDSRDSDVNIDSNSTEIIKIQSGMNERRVDLGLIALKNINGFVKADLNNDQQPDVPLSNVEIRLSSCDNSLNLVKNTNENGFYSFQGLSPGCYIITEIDPEGYTSVSDVDGENDNNISVTLSNTDITSRDFLDEPLLKISGHARADMDFDNDVEVGTAGSNDVVLKDVSIDLYKNNEFIATTKTDENGFYEFANVTPGDYRVKEIDPQGFDSLKDADGGDKNEITVIIFDADIVDRDFDDQKNITVSGTIKVDIDGDKLVDEPLENSTLLLCLAGEACTLQSNIATAVTDENGQYKFTGLKPGNYQIIEIDQEGYDSLSDIDGANDNIINLNLDGHGDVVGQDFENLAVAPVFIVIEKTVAKKEASVGDFIPYSITIENTNDTFNYAAVSIKDLIPSGFKYVNNSAQIIRENESLKIATQGNEVIKFGLFTLNAGEKIKLTYLLKVGVSVAYGDHVNRATAMQNEETVSNESIASIRIIADDFIDNATLVGKVFEDPNENGIQDNSEKGIPGVRLATAEGLIIETDGFGRYHVADVKSGGFGGRGSNFIIKVDPTTLPKDAEFTTENPRVYRITSGALNVVDFGIKLPKQEELITTRTVEKVEMKDEVKFVKKTHLLGSIYFDSDQDCIRPDQVKTLNKMADKLKALNGGQIFIEGNTDARAPAWYNKKLAYNRAKSVYRELKYYLGDSINCEIEVIYKDDGKEVKFDPRYDWWGKPNAPKTKKDCMKLGKPVDCYMPKYNVKGGNL